MRVVQMHDQRAQRQLLLAAFGGMDLTDKQWAVPEPIFRPRRRPDGRGRPWTARRANTLLLYQDEWLLTTQSIGFFIDYPWARRPLEFVSDRIASRKHADKRFLLVDQ